MKKVFTLSLLLITCICLVFNMHNRWKGNNWKATINADGYGYYAYLPCIFSLHSFDYEKIITEERQLRPEVSYDDAETCFPKNMDKRTDKFFAGESILLLPFFLLAYLIALVFGFDTGGYSLPFQIGVSLGALFYLIVGLIFLRKLLKEYNFSDSVIALTAVILVMGTNLLYYSTMEPSMSHVYCFSLTAIFLYYIKICCTNFSSKTAVKASVVFCLLLIVRPTNINSLVLIPFIAVDFATLKNLLRNIFKPKVLLVIAGASIPILLIQSLIWKIETGHFLYWSYLGEKFYFTSPKFMSFLFSFRNGWFIYTPLMLVILVFGLVILLRHSFYQFFTFLLFFVFAVYLLSSWYAWYYGGYGMRAVIDYYAAFAILLALCLSHFNKNKVQRLITSVVLGFLIFVNITQTRQFTNLIFKNEYMTKEKYFQLFLRTDSKYVGIFEKLPPTGINFINNLSFQNGFEYKEWGNNNSNSITDENAHNNRHSACIGEKANESPVFSIKAGDLPLQHNIYAYIEAAVFMLDSLNDAKLALVLQTKDGVIYSSTNVSLKESVPYFSNWELVTKTFAIPSFQNNDDSLKIYFSATRGKTFIDDERISFGIKR